MIELSSALGTPRLKRKLGIRSHTAVRQKKTKKKRNQVRKDKNKKKQKTKKTKEAEEEFH